MDIMDFNCPFTDLCQYCNDYFFDNCCLHKTYERKDFKKCAKIGICPNLYVCRDTINGKLSRMSLFNNIIPSLEDIKSYEYIVKKPFKKFNNRFIPRIEVFGSNFKNQMKIIKKLEIECIAVSLTNMISNKEGEILKENFKNNLHDRLGFDGKILLQTNIPDCYCIKIMENHQKYIDAINCLNPDIITTFDANFYLDQPLFINFIQIINILNANLLISELDIPQIFLLPPVPLPLFKSIFEVFLKSNHASICIPIAEFSKSKNPYFLKLLYYINHIKETSDKEFELLLLSKSPDIKMYADCYSSNTWTKIRERNTEEDYLNKMERKLQKTIQNANEMKFQKTLFSYLRMV
jgi:hypothetical protein